MEKKYGFDNVEKISGIEFKWSIAVTALLLISMLGWISLGSTITTILALLSWWSFRRYFLRVGDKLTGNFLLFVMIVIALYGVSIATLKTLFSLEALFIMGDPRMILKLFKTIFIAVGILSFGVIISSIKVIAANRHHTFPLKRIAISTAIGIPLMVIVGVAGSLTFISQLGSLMYAGIPEKTLYTDGYEYFYLMGDIGFGGDIMKDILGDISSIISFILSPFIFFYKVMVILPYLFLLQHFYKMDKRNTLKT